MKSLRTVVALALLVVLAASVYGWWRTTPASGSAPRTARTAPLGDVPQPIIDSAALETARRLLPLATTPEEHRVAASAVDKADHLLDLAFAAALREATEHPAPPTPAVQGAQTRLDAAAQRLITDNQQVVQLTEAVAKAKGDRNGPLEGELALAQAQFEVDQYEFNQAGADLVAVGGDQRAKIEALVAEHRAATPKAPPPVAAAGTQPGLIHLFERLAALRLKDRALADAHAQVNAAIGTLANARASLTRRIALQAPGTSKPDATGTFGGAARPPEVAAALLATTRQVVADQKALADVDNRSTTERELAALYEQWRTIVAAQTTEVLHGILLAVAIIAGACLLLLFFGRWLGAAFDRLHLDRRQVETLRTVTTVVLQVAAVLFIALVIVGPPSQLGVFLGLAGAGLTVALKDFIVAFVGWLVLMGKNGIRLGDWVEINGVAGEVVELGIFHTVLLETGNWTDSGHPTGRRVTFTNSFAIEGHYFNFSTTGQWLWDELQIVVPTGQDLYAVVAAITEKVKEATATNAREAEDEWRRATPSRKLTGLTAAPAVNVKPVVGGTEIALRYIARANERYRLRAALYQAAVELLGQKPVAAGKPVSDVDPTPVTASAP
jgi:small-conductance mechanosensitive channel